jgi:2,4-dienoyl-CoA reductase-like NADH-dependent reductase (Old Yellow Enzyme family)
MKRTFELAHTPALFQPITFRSVTIKNRIVVSPMCQYSATNGLGSDWHIQNLGAKAAGGAGIVFTEATHVSDLGRITQGCLGLWNDAHLALATRLASLISACGATPGMQIAHAGRKASTGLPWEGGKPVPLDAGGWTPEAPSPLPFSDAHNMPHALTTEEIRGVIAQFAATARMAREAGFKILELHGAHGYLIHSFLSPLSNNRRDGYGGDLAGRARMLMETIDAVRAEWADDLPLFVRLSCTDWVDGGITIDDTVQLARMLKARGDIDLIDCSSGGLSPLQKIPTHPGYQVPFADRIRRETGIATGAVGLISAPAHADEIIANQRADLVFLARAVLADPAWPTRAALKLGVTPDPPPQYQRALLGR